MDIESSLPTTVAYCFEGFRALSLPVLALAFHFSRKHEQDPTAAENSN